MAFLKPCRSRAEYKIGSALYVTIIVILPAGFAIQEYNILVAYQPAIVKDGFIAMAFYRYRLPGIKACIILYGDIFSSKIITQHQKTIGRPAGKCAACGRYFAGMVIIGQNSPGVRFALYRYKVFGAVQLKLLLIGAIFNIDQYRRGII